MARNIVNDGTIDMNQLLIEVLGSDSSFGSEMKTKISNALDVVTNRIKAGATSMKFSSDPVTIGSITGVDSKKQKAIATKIETQQNNILEWIKKVAAKSNWKNITAGANITDILGSDKAQNERFAKQYADLQNKILKAIKENIPTKETLLPKELSKATKKQTKKDKTEKETAGSDVELTGVEKIGDKISSLLPPKGVEVTDDKLTGTEPLSDKISMLLPPLETISDKISMLILPRKDDKEPENKDNKEIQSLIDSMFEKLSVSADKKTDVEGREAFTEHPDPVIIMEFDDKAIEQLSGALPGTDKKQIKGMKPEKEGDGFFKTALKAVGIIALMGLLKYFYDNPEKWDAIKLWFKDKFIPFFTIYLPKWFNEDLIPWVENDLPILIKTIKLTVEDIFGQIGLFFGNIGRAARGELVEFGKKEWWATNIAASFIAIGKGLGIIAADFMEAKDKMKSDWEKADGIWEKYVLITESIINMTTFIPKQIILSVDMALDKLFKDRWKKFKEGVATRHQKAFSEKNINENSLRGYEIAWEWFKRRRGSFTDDKELDPDRFILSSILGNKDDKSVSIAEGTSNDFIYREGQPLQRFSEGDTVIGVKDNIVVENKNLDKQMFDLTSVMNTIKDKFDDLLLINSKMLERGVAQHNTSQPLPGINSDIGSHRALAYDESYNHKMKVWELLHGVA